MATLLMTAFFQRHSIRMKMAIVYVQYASFLDRHQPKRIQDLLGSRWVQQFQCILWNFMFLYKIYLVIIVDLIFVNCHWILVCKINASEIDLNFTPAFFLYNLWWNVTSLNVSNHNILHIWTIFLSVYKQKSPLRFNPGKSASFLSPLSSPGPKRWLMKWVCLQSVFCYHLFSKIIYQIDCIRDFFLFC